MISRNERAGIQIVDGAGDVNVTGCSVSHNYGDGINMTYSGGRVNVSYSQVESNAGFGLVAWYNQSSPKLALQQHFIVAFNQFALNDWSAVQVGNFCTQGSVNVSSNVFRDSLSNALEIRSCWQQSAPLRNVSVAHNQVRLRYDYL